MQLQFHDIAVEISRREYGAINLDIAQISEVLRHTLDILAEADETAVMLALRRRKKIMADSAVQQELERQEQLHEMIADPESVVKLQEALRPLGQVWEIVPDETDTSGSIPNSDSSHLND